MNLVLYCFGDLWVAPTGQFDVTGDLGYKAVVPNGTDRKFKEQLRERTNQMMKLKKILEK